jgi:dTDP-4-dehydrorhamnose reductase
MKILVFGRVGQVGSALAELLPDRYEVEFLDQPEIDLTEPASLTDYVLSQRPEIVINAAAYTAVDRAESEPALAHAINAIAPGVMALACKEVNAIFVHYSTDYVFDGTATEPYTEDARVAPRSVYGKSKLLGEQAVIAATHRYVILRTAWLYSYIGHNFLKTMLRLAEEGNDIGVVVDQFGSPTFACDLATATVSIIDAVAGGPEDFFGLYHVTNAGVTCWYDFAEKIFQLIGKEITLVPLRTEDYPTPAHRPAYSVLSCERLRRVFGVTLPDWQDATARCLGRLDREKLTEPVSS